MKTREGVLLGGRTLEHGEREVPKRHYGGLMAGIFCTFTRGSPSNRTDLFKRRKVEDQVFHLH